MRWGGGVHRTFAALASTDAKQTTNNTPIYL